MNDIPPPRVFVGLKLAPEIAGQLAELARPLGSYSVRLVPSADMHLTLVPPWNEPDVASAAERVRSAVDGFGDFSLTFVRLLYGPTLRRPHLLWAECAASDALAKLRTALLSAFGQIDQRPFRPHVTVARLPTNGRSIAQKIAMDQALSLTQCVNSVELFRSPRKQEKGYQVLVSVALGGEQHLEST